MILIVVLALVACAPVQPLERIQCYDQAGHGIPCVEKMDCHGD